MTLPPNQNLDRTENLIMTLPGHKTNCQSNTDPDPDSVRNANPEPTVIMTLNLTMNRTLNLTPTLSLTLTLTPKTSNPNSDPTSSLPNSVFRLQNLDVFSNHCPGLNMRQKSEILPHGKKSCGWRVAQRSV